MDNIACTNTHLRAFQLKGSFLTLTTLELLTINLSDIDAQLLSLTKQTPDLFRRMPVIVDLNKIKNLSDFTIDFSKLKLLLENQGLIPLGIRGGNSEQEKLAVNAGFAALNNGKLEKAAKKPAEKNISPQIHTDSQKPFSKLVTAPVRSGQQIYAKNGDLVILGTVSPGSEIIADGNIHVYGALRGRALAGVNGNKHARIFCHELKAELVSITGIYWVNEDISLPDEKNRTIQIYLDNDKLQLSAV